MRSGSGCIRRWWSWGVPLPVIGCRSARCQTCVIMPRSGGLSSFRPRLPGVRYVGAGLADLLDLGQRVAELGQPLLRVAPDEAHAPGEGVGPAAGDAARHQGVE